MKKFTQKILQRVLGFRNYLFLFAWFKIKTLRWDKGEGTFHHFLQMLPPNSRVLDIGANIGIMTVLLAQRCHQGKVIAVEPIPENFGTLSRICRYFKLKNVTLLPIALGEEEGFLEMIMPEVKKVKMQGLSHVVHESIEAYHEGSKYRVPQTCLDHLQEGKAGVDAIKIDVENFEYFVFKGGMDLLRKNMPVIYCELWDNQNRQNCFRLLRDELGYEIKVLEGRELVEFNPERHAQQNFFFLPRVSD